MEAKCWLRKVGIYTCYEVFAVPALCLQPLPNKFTCFPHSEVSETDENCGKSHT